MGAQIKIEIANQLGVLLSKPKKIKIIVGGRASTKTTFMADNVLSEVQQGFDWCCGRETQESIEDSVHSMLREEIERINFQGFDVRATSIHHATGGRIFYKGLSRNVTSLKGLNAKGLWIEEGEGLSANTLRILTASLRVTANDAKKAREAGVDAKVPEIWITMNRGSSKDPISQKFLQRAEKDLAKTGFYEDDYMMIVQINWDDIPKQWFLDSGLEIERLDDLDAMSTSEYDHKWGGQYRDTVHGAIIKPTWFDACIDAHKKDEYKDLFSHGKKIAAHDPFDDGTDAGGYALREGSIIRYVSQKDEGEIDETCDWATGLAIEQDVDWFVWDGDGMGTGLKRQVSDAFKNTGINYHMFKGSLSGIGQDRGDVIYMKQGDEKTKQLTYAKTFKNNRAQYYAELMRRVYNTFKLIERGEDYSGDDILSFDSDGIENLDLLRSEICRIPKKENGNGLFQIMSKAEMAKIGIDSPNMADSVMMLIYLPVSKRPAQTFNQSSLGF